MSRETLSLDKIRIDGGTQSRARIDDSVVADYAEALGTGAEFPPVIVFHDGADYWLADGFHRHAAYAGAGRAEIPADIRQGAKRDAILFSVGANSAHGLRRTNEDKRRAVTVLLNDPEWSAWSNREIARQCVVDEKTVRSYREAICGSSADRRTVTRGGATYQQNTANIGQRPPLSTTDAFAALGDDTPPPPREPKEAAPPAPANDPARPDLSGLTREGLEDEVTGLREENAEMRAANTALTRERDDFKTRWEEATASNQGAMIGRLQKQLVAVKFERDEAKAATKRMERRAKTAEARVAELEAMEVPLSA